MGIKLRFNKGPESGKVEVTGGLLSNVTGKITLKTPFGSRKILPDGSIESKIPVTEMSTPKPTSKSKKGSK